MGADGSFTARELFAAVLHQRRAVALAALLTAAATGIGSCFQPERYVASGSLLVKLGREFIYRPELGGMDSSEMYRLDEMINSETELLASRDLAAAVVDEIGSELYPEGGGDPRWRVEAVAAFADALTVTAVPESSVIRLSFEHSDPELAARALNLLIDRFRDKHVEVFGDASAPFLAARAREAEEGLRAAEERAAAFRAEHGVFELAQQNEQLLRQRAKIDTELKATDTRVRELEELTRNGWPETAADDGVPVGSFPPLSSLENREAVEDAQMQLLQLRMRERQQTGRYSDVSRELTALRGEIQLVESFLIEAIHDELDATRERRAAQAEQLAAIDAEVARLAAAAGPLAQLERELEALREQQRTWRTRSDEARVSALLQEEDLISVRVLDRASPPLRPRGLSTPARLALGALTGLALGVALAVLRRTASPVG